MSPDRTPRVFAPRPYGGIIGEVGFEKANRRAQDMLDPLGVGVIAEAQHFCMMMRGVEKQHSGTVTSTMPGAFRENKETRNEFLSLVRK